MRTFRLFALVVVPCLLMGWILATLDAPWWVWCVWAVYTLDRAGQIFWGGRN